MVKWQNAIIFLLNFDGWELNLINNKAIGKTPKGINCVMDMEFLDTYNEKKILKKDRYDALMELDDVKLFFVNDPKGNFMYYLNTLKMPKLINDVYLLKENQASRINLTLK
jgi:hypothetical protein